MTVKFPTQVLAFAGEANKKPYEQFVDFFNHYRAMKGREGLEYQTQIETDNGFVPLSFSEKEEKMNATIKREIMRVAGIQNFEQFPIETWASHPTLRWATFAVISAMIDMVLPDAIIDNVGMFSDVRTLGWGDSAAFDVKPRDIFVVSKAGRSKRTTELNKQFVGQVTVMPEPREMTVFVSLMKVLAGKESLAEFVMKMVRSFETQLSYDVYDAFRAALEVVDSSADGLKVTGFTETEFIRLSQTVGAWNGGTRPLAIGTQLALANVIPANANYRYDLQSEYVKLGYLTDFKGTDIMVLPQVADWTTPFGLKLTNDRIWIISPASDKIIKLVLEGNTLSYQSDAYANANLVQTSTLLKSWGTAVATSQVAATITL